MPFKLSLNGEVRFNTRPAELQILAMIDKKLFFLMLIMLFYGGMATGGTRLPLQRSGKQSISDDSMKVFSEISFFGASINRTPFWINANRYGIIPQKVPSGQALVGLEYHHSRASKNALRISAYLDVAANISRTTSVLLPQAQIAFARKNWEVSIGRKRQWIGLADSTIGTGSFAWSGNALPLPKLQIGTTGFTNVPLTNGWLSFNAFYSEGLFEAGRSVTSNLRLHQKAFYLRIGKAASRLRFFGGFNHQVQWGGSSPYLTIDGKMPRGLKNYLRIITGKPGDANPVPNSFDNGNRVGNHLGTIDLGLELEGYEYALFLYRQNIYEDGSLYALANIGDGLNGLKIRRKNSYGANFEVNTLVLEFLYTKSQGGAAYDFDKQIIHKGSLGKDDYFNNAQIRDGWSYHDRTIGSPFITPTSETVWAKPRYADFFTSNNRVSVMHIGLKGTLFRRIIWTGKCSYSSNFGTYDQPFVSPARQFSCVTYLQTNFDLLGKTSVTGAFALDAGKLYPKTFGFSVSLRKDFSIH